MNEVDAFSSNYRQRLWAAAPRAQLRTRPGRRLVATTLPGGRLLQSKTRAQRVAGTPNCAIIALTRVRAAEFPGPIAQTFIIPGDPDAASDKAALPDQRRPRRWLLAFDTDTRRLFVEHEKTRGDTRGRGYSIETDELELADYLNETGPGQHELVRLLGTLFAEEHADA